MLNAALTVRAHTPQSHANKGWEVFTSKVLECVAKGKPVVFLVWGTPAAKRIEGIVDKNKHLVLKSVHPSPLSASRGFFECGHFKKANEWLELKYGKEGPINWDTLNSC